MRDYTYDIDCGKYSVPGVGIPLYFNDVVTSLDACVAMCDNDVYCGVFNLFNNGTCQTFNFRSGEVADCNAYVTGQYTP